MKDMNKRYIWRRGEAPSKWKWRGDSFIFKISEAYAHFKFKRGAIDMSIVGECLALPWRVWGLALRWILIAICLATKKDVSTDILGGPDDSDTSHHLSLCPTKSPEIPRRCIIMNYSWWIVSVNTFEPLLFRTHRFEAEGLMKRIEKISAKIVITLVLYNAQMLQNQNVFPFVQDFTGNTIHVTIVWSYLQ